jgi:cathepsin B
MSPLVITLGAVHLALLLSGIYYISRDKSSETSANIAHQVNLHAPKKSWAASNYPRWEKFTPEDLKDFVSHNSISVKRIDHFGKYIGHDHALVNSITIDRIRVKNFPFHKNRADLPNNFDLRTVYPKCPSLARVEDQGMCGNSWAVSAASVITDRVCIITNGAKKFQASIQEFMSCCIDCGQKSVIHDFPINIEVEQGHSGCYGGDVKKAFEFWQKQGVPSGSGFLEKSGCKPYSIPPCLSEKNLSKSKVFSFLEKLECRSCSKDGQDWKIPPCEGNCQKSYRKNSYQKDKLWPADIYKIFGEENIMREVMENGPVVAVMTIYQDFFVYR